MIVGQGVATYVVAAVACFLVATLVLRWAHPVNGALSPKLRAPGMEMLVSGIATLAAMLALGFTIGAIVSALSS